MNLSNIIAQMLLDMIEANGSTEIQRNELAEQLGCVPSQINYVISSRFTPEQGYIVESRRGGGGYIKISRVNLERADMIMHLVNAIGKEIDEKTCRAHIVNLVHQEYLSPDISAIMLAAMNETSYRCLPPENRDAVRAGIFKQMLLASL